MFGAITYTDFLKRNWSSLVLNIHMSLDRIFLFLETCLTKHILHAHANRFVQEDALSFISCGGKKGKTTCLSIGKLVHELLPINFILLLERIR